MEISVHYSDLNRKEHSTKGENKMDIIADMLDDENVPQPHILWDMNYLYEAFNKSMKGSSWKGEPQKFQLDLAYQLTRISESLKNHTYQTDPTSEFVLNERGKKRYIHGNTIKDRIVRHNLCDNIITPAIEKYLIYNNGASQKGKGISFSREQFEKDLHNFYLKYHDNNGYVLFIDFSKFYDNINHSQTKEMFDRLIDDKSNKLLREIIDSFNIDITKYPTVDPEDKFDSIAFHELLPENLPNLPERYLNKGIDIGDQTSQNIGVFYPTRIDTYATVVRGHKWYGRYMDDIYIIHRDKEYLQETLRGIKELSEKYGLFTNEKKTRICHLSNNYTYLQVKYSLNSKGKVIKRINPKSITREKRKLKAYKRLLDKNIMSYKDIEQAYKSWICNYYKIMSKKQIENMQFLYFQLFNKKVRYKT